MKRLIRRWRWHLSLAMFVALLFASPTLLGRGFVSHAQDDFDSFCFDDSGFDGFDGSWDGGWDGGWDGSWDYGWDRGWDWDGWDWDGWDFEFIQ